MKVCYVSHVRSTSENNNTESLQSCHVIWVTECCVECKRLKSFPRHVYRYGSTDLHFLSSKPHTSWCWETMIWGPVHHTACLLPASASNHSTYPQRDGQAKLTYVAGYILWRVTHPSTKCRSVTSLLNNQTATKKVVSELMGVQVDEL